MEAAIKQKERKRVLLGNLTDGFVPEENIDYLVLSDNRTISIRAYGYKYHCDDIANNYGNVLIKTDRIILEKSPKNSPKNHLLMMIIPSESISCVSTLDQTDPYVRHGLRIYKRENKL